MLFIFISFFLMIRRPPRSTRTEHTLSLHDALPIYRVELTAGIIQFATLRQTLRIEYAAPGRIPPAGNPDAYLSGAGHGTRYAATARRLKARPMSDEIPRGWLPPARSEEHTSELQSLMRN